MRSSWVRSGTAAAAVALIGFGLLSNRWWTMKLPALGGELEGFVSEHIGLRGGEICVAGACETVSFVDRGGGFTALLMQLTYWGGLLVVTGFVAGTALREIRGEARLARIAGTACVALMLCSILVVTIGMLGGGDLMPSYSGAAVVIGCLVGVHASRMEQSAWDGGSEASHRTATTSEVVPTREPAVTPPATARQISHELGAKVRDATRTSSVPPKAKALRAQGAASIADASVDAARSSLRFVAASIEIGDHGLTALAGTERRELAFADITRVIARRLPPDPPYEKIVLVDLVATGRPIRILASTAGNYDVLPGPSSVLSIDNLRKLGATIAARHPGVLEPQSEGFFLHGKQPEAFHAIKQFAAYDSQFA